MTSVHAPKAKTWGTSLLIKQRERAACPQLRCVPPDLRGDGARHASHESLPPSKPFRPHAGVTDRERCSAVVRLSLYIVPHDLRRPAQAIVRYVDRSVAR